MVSQVFLLPLFATFAWLASGVYHIIYNIYFHPLREFPGPLAGRASGWYLTYIEVWKNESLCDAYLREHQQHGDVIRVAPNRLHFSNPEAYNDIYVSKRFNKDAVQYAAFGAPRSHVTMASSAAAKPRREALLGMFSRRNVLNLEGLLRRHTDQLVTVLAKGYANGKSMDMLFAFRSWATDTIMMYCFGNSLNTIDDPAFSAPLIVAMHSVPPAGTIFKHFPLLPGIVKSFPEAILRKTPAFGFKSVRIFLRKKVQEILKNPDSLTQAEHPTIFHRLLDPEAQKGSPIPEAADLEQEGQTLLVAGSFTVSDTLMMTHFYILNQPKLYAKLKTAVREVWPDANEPASLETLETLPLLIATIKEGLRTGHGVAAPRSRVVPLGGATIAGHFVPGGAIVAIAHSFVHNSSAIFESPHEFKAERWLGEDGKRLDQWLVAFGRGARSCIGVNLAWAELTIGLGTMLRRFDMTMDGTKIEDLGIRDCFAPYFYGRHLHAWCKPALE